MPVKFFDVGLALMNEQQLRWQAGELVVLLFGAINLDREIPLCDLIVRSSGSEDRRLLGMPLNGRYRRGVLLECSHRARRARAQLSQVPYSHDPVVTARHEETRFLTIPGYDVDV